VVLAVYEAVGLIVFISRLAFAPFTRQTVTPNLFQEWNSSKSPLALEASWTILPHRFFEVRKKDRAHHRKEYSR
jgi:hypothetical protein